MVRAFTAHLNARYKKRRNELKIQFELLPVPSDQLIPMLLSGRGDMIAARLTVTPERSVQVLFSAPYREVDELVVGHSAIADVKFVHDLADRRIAVRRSSSYYASLLEESRRLVAEGKQPIQIETVDPVLETEDILALVAAGRFDFTVADSIVAETAIEIHPKLSALRGLELRRGGKLAWATHLTAPALRREMSEFLRVYQHGSLLGNIGIKKYFRDLGAIRARQSGTTASLSDYDAELRRYAGEFGFDWRLMAAVAYQESRFDQGARNRSGAVGLFQIKPTTAREPYVGIADVAGPENASNNIHAGIKYLAWIKGRYFDGVESMRERDRLRMALAAYNAGPKTLINARKRAERMGLDPNRWFRNVELALLAMNKVEPVKYVSEINQHYLSYVMLGIE
jgi:membrane-bound lytic murein transglycosylase MltF